VRVDPSLIRYAVEIVAATRDRSEVLIGGSPRASLGLVRLAQARALVLEREFILPDDIKELADAVLTHRLVMRAGGEPPRVLVQEILARVPVPVATR
jgi:MoxR-like ATPase